MILQHKFLGSISFFSFLILSVIIFPANYLQAQIISKNNAQILLRGWLLDPETDAPIEAEIRIETEDGKSFKISSNSLTGKFEQIFESGKTYKLRASGKTILAKEFTITLPQVKNYSEQTDTFYIKQLQIGRTIEQYSLFVPNSAELTDGAEKLLDELNTQLRFNRDPHLLLTITGCDSKDAFTQTVKSTSKTKSKQKTTQSKFDDVGFEKLLLSRVEVIQAKISNFDQLKDRIEIKSDPAFDCIDNQADAFLIVKDIKSKMK